MRGLRGALQKSYANWMTEKADYEALAANLLKAELKRKSVTYAQLVERLAAIDVDEKEVNIRNKLSRGEVHGSFLVPVPYGNTAE